MANTATKIDWDCASTKRHIQEAKKRKLILIGPGLDRNSRMYEFMECRHQQVIRIVSVRNEDQLCDTCLKDTSIKSDFYSPSGTEKIRLKRYEKWLNNCLKKTSNMIHRDKVKILISSLKKSKILLKYFHQTEVSLDKFISPPLCNSSKRGINVATLIVSKSVTNIINYIYRIIIV